MGVDRANVSIALLGPTVVNVGGDERPITARRQRAILARLALDAGQPVSADRLLDDVWGEQLPSTGAKAVALQISKLRNALEPGRSGDGSLIGTSAAGYRLDVDRDAVDVHRFDRLLDDARGAVADTPSSALRSAEAAIELWRGTPLGDLGDETFVDAEVRRLDHQFLRLRRTRVEALLGLGRPQDVIVELETLVEEQPLEERLVELLMLACHRSGRPADALRAYGDLRRRLGEELGIEPSSELRRLEGQLLEGGPAEVAPPTHDHPLPGRSDLDRERADLPSGMVTFLLSDVVGSTRLWEEHSEHMGDAIELHDELIDAAVRRAGGRMLKSKGEGDSTFNVFSRASDAARAALEIQRRLAGAEWPGGVALTTRTAIHTGEAIERLGDYYGRTVNRVARLRGIAAGGEILLTRATADLVIDELDDDIHLERLGLQQLRDLDRPETVFALRTRDGPDDSVTTHTPVDVSRQTAPLDAMPLPTRLRAVAAETIVGRRDELGLLIEAWEDVLDGRPAFCSLRGDAGIGKTRLAAEFAGIAHDQGALVTMGRCDEFSTAPFEPIGEALRFVVERLGPAMISELFGRSAGTLARLLPDLIPADDERPGNADAEHQRLLEALATAFEAISRQVPLLFVIDDLHWGDPATLGLLRRMLVHDQAGRIMIVATLRPSERDASILVDLAVDAHQLTFADHVIDLTGLGLTDTAELLRRAPVADEIADDVAHRVHELTTGNPLFTLGVVNSLGTEGSHGDTIDLPDSLLAILDRQLDGLAAEHLVFLQAAAILGSTFEVDLAAALADVSFEVVEHALDAAERLRIVHEEAAGQLHLYSFEHGLLPNRLAARASTIRRRSLNARATQLVSTSVVDGDRVGRAARHAMAAGSLLDADVAIEVFRRAAQQAADRVAVDEAVEWLELAVERAADRDPASTLGLRIELGTAMQRANRYEWRRVLDETYTHAREIGDDEHAVLAVIAGDRGTFSTLMAPDPTRIEQLRWALDRVTTPDDRRRARLLAGLASELTFVRGDRERFTLIDEALSIATGAEDPELLLRVYEHRVNILSGPAHIEQRRSDVDAVLDLFERADAPAYRRVVWLGALSHVHEMLGEGDAGRRRFAEMDQLARTERLVPRQLIQIEMVRAPWQLIDGALDDATTSLRAAHSRSRDHEARRWLDPMAGAVTARQMLAVRFWQDRSESMLDAMAGMVETVPSAVAHYAYWLIETGRIDEAAEQWARWDDDWLPHSDALGAFTESWALEAAGVCAYFDGRDRCRFYYDLLEPFADLLLNVYAPDQPTHHYLGLLARAIGDSERAREHFASSRAFARRLGAPLMEARAGLELASELDAAGDSDTAIDLAGHAVAVGRDHRAAWLTRTGGEALTAMGAD